MNQEDQVVDAPASPAVTTPTSTNSGTSASNATPAFSYDDLFPALPANAAPIGNANSTPALRGSTTTQKTQVGIFKGFLQNSKN